MAHVPIQMEDISVLQHRCLLNLERRIRDFGQDPLAEERCLRLQKDGDTLRSAGWNPAPIWMGLWGSISPKEMHPASL